MGQTNAAITMICVMTQSSLRSRKVLISLSITTKIQRVVSYHDFTVLNYSPMGPALAPPPILNPRNWSIEAKTLDIQSSSI